MRSKELRLLKIRGYMRSVDGGSTISKIHNWIQCNTQMKITRKTIERDIYEMIERKEIIQKEGYPIRFHFISNRIYQIELTLEEINSVLELLTDRSDIYKKIFQQINKDKRFDELCSVTP